MVTKTLTITEDAYDLLAREKREDESFSTEIKRLLGKRESIREFAGAWSMMSDGTAEKIKEDIKKSRQQWSKRAKERSHDLS